MKYKLVVISLSLMVFGCKKERDHQSQIGSESTNILLIIADDMGKDATSGFSEGNVKPNTPNIDLLRNTGLSFSNFWSYPTCSPTRASIITGKYGYRTGVKWANDVLDPSETVLQRYLNEGLNQEYATAIIGKWHLSGEDASVNPESFGIDHYAGLIRGAVQDYYQWQLTEDGAGSLQTQYISEVFTDLSIDWINDQSKPWFLWLAYNAPHTPFHVPPMEMHSQGALPDFVDGMDPIPYYMAAIEAMDYQVGRLLSEIPENELSNTTIIFLGDNGTMAQAAQTPYSPGTVKGSLYQGGVNVPLFVSGEGVNRVGVDDNLLCSTDLFATIADIAGVGVSEIHDSKSFKNLLQTDGDHREFQYVEKNDGIDDSWAISNGEYKLIIHSSGIEELYNLQGDPYEQNDLIPGGLSVQQQQAKEELEGELADIRN